MEPSPSKRAAFITPVALMEEITDPVESRHNCAIWLGRVPVDTMSRAACGTRVEMPMVLAARLP